MDTLDYLEKNPIPFAKLLGIKFLSAAPERLTAEMVVREDLCTLPSVLHGRAMMSLADTLGGAATVLSLQGSGNTTTIESKTNFLAAAPVGSKVFAECTPLHRGRRTMVWQTRITSPDGRLLAVVVQTQLVL